LHAVLGWELFKKFLVIHHQAEDDALWPPLRAAVADHPDRLALLDEPEAEHAVIEPLLAAIDAAASDPDYGYQRFSDIIDELTGKLPAHLVHEEADGLPLTGASLTPRSGSTAAPSTPSGSATTVRWPCPRMLDRASPQYRDAFEQSPRAAGDHPVRQWEPSTPA